MTTVVTGWNANGYEEYGRNFLITFDRYWPSDVKLMCYIETNADAVDVKSRAQLRSLWLCDGAQAFLDRHRKILSHNGRERNPKWRERDFRKPYNYRFDACKFFKQMMIPAHASQSVKDGEVLAWFDADVVTLKDIPNGFVEKFLGNHDLVYLGRSGTHSEIGFWAVRLNAGTRTFLSDLATIYRTDAVFELKEWHSAFCWDVCRRRFEGEGGSVRNLTPGGSGHVWHSVPELAAVTDHLKGARKKLGRSPERAS